MQPGAAIGLGTIDLRSWCTVAVLNGMPRSVGR